MVGADGGRAVFLDRDGVLTVPIFRDGRSYAPLSLADFRLYDGAAASVARLRHEGFQVVVATNQPDVSTGRLALETLEVMHQRLFAELKVDAIEVSFATRAAPDRRRKPAPGMLHDAAARLGIDLRRSYMVGDRASDIACGEAAGCRTIFIDLGYTAEIAPEDQNVTVASFTDAVDWILRDAGNA